MLERDLMYRIKEKEFRTLTDAMEWAKTTDEFVVILGPSFEACGRFGVDSIKNGLCPDGVVYDWNKANRIGRVSKKVI